MEGGGGVGGGGGGGGGGGAGGGKRSFLNWSEKLISHSSDGFTKEK